MNDLSSLPRAAEPRLRQLLRVMPVVVLTGARQTGKSTLAEAVGLDERRYRSLDDFDVLDTARRDPESVVEGRKPLTLDEVQRAPELLVAVKRAVDRDRRPGRFLLTGSADLLLMQQASESLAGRAGFLTLWPMSRRETAGLGRSGIWEELLTTSDSEWLDVVRAQPEDPTRWRGFAERGGFPVPALHLNTPDERTEWFDGYQRSYLERDLRVLARITALPDYRRLMRIACLRLGQLINQTELGRDAAVKQPTAARWLDLLETSYLLVRLPPFAVNRTKRLVKTPKLYWSDTGLALSLTGENPDGAHLENIVLHDLLVWRDARISRHGRAELHFWRTASGEEVDFVVEVGDRLLPIEVKATTRPRLRDTAGLRAFRAEYGEQCRPGLLLHGGSSIEWLTDDVLAAPWWRVL